MALFFSGPWDLARLKKEAPPDVYAEVGTALLPVTRADATSASVQGGSLFVPEGAAHREAAFEFMKWAVSDRYASRLAQEMGRYPVRAALYQAPSWGDDPLLQPFLDQLKTVRPYKLEAYASADRVWDEAARHIFVPNAMSRRSCARPSTKPSRRSAPAHEAVRVERAGSRGMPDPFAERLTEAPGQRGFATRPSGSPDNTGRLDPPCVQAVAPSRWWCRRRK